MNEKNNLYEHKYSADRFKNELEGIQLPLTDEQIEKFMITYEMLVQTNKVMNLTAITDFDDVIIKHFIDSLSIVRIKKVRDSLIRGKDLKVIDMGTGAGFPGIPLAIAFPNVKFVLVDALLKRVKYLTALIEKINLTNVTVMQKRAEDIGRDPIHREQYDIAVSRAVANLSPLCEYCLPLVKVNGDFIAYKSNKAEEEIATSKRAITSLGGKIEGTETFLMNNPSDSEKIERTLIDIKKVKKTPATYPRKAGVPTKKPL